MGMGSVFSSACDARHRAAKWPVMRMARMLRLAIAALFVAMGGHASANNVTGGWLSPPANNWPLIAIHAALTPDGRVLSYGTTGTGTQTGYFIYDVWDP